MVAVLRRILQFDATLGIDFQELDSPPPQLCYVFTGAGATWTGMVYDMMRFKVFRDSIVKLDKAMNPYGMTIYDNILHKKPLNSATESNVMLVAVQVRLQDDKAYFQLFVYKSYYTCYHFSLCQFSLAYSYGQVE